MESREPYRVSALPDLSGRGATAAKTFIVVGPLALLGAHLASDIQSVAGAGQLLGRVAVPLMLAWAVVLFLITRTVAPIAAGIGLVGVTLQVTLFQEVTHGWVLLVVEFVGFAAFAVALSRLWWVPRVVPVALVAFPVVDVLTPEHATLLEVAAFAGFVAVGLVLAVRLRWAGTAQSDASEPDREWVGRRRSSVRTAGVEADPAWVQRVLPPIG